MASSEEEAEGGGGFASLEEEVEFWRRAVESHKAEIEEMQVRFNFCV